MLKEDSLKKTEKIRGEKYTYLKLPYFNMTKRHIKILILILILIIPFKIILPYYAKTNIHKKTHIILDFDQFDSLCVVDSIPRDLNKWNSHDYIGENEKLITNYMYLKGDTVVYNVVPLNDGYFDVIKSNNTEVSP